MTHRGVKGTGMPNEDSSNPTPPECPACFGQTEWESTGTKYRCFFCGIGGTVHTTGESAGPR